MRGNPDPKTSSEGERASLWNALGDEWQTIPALSRASGLSERRIQVAKHDMILGGIGIVSGSEGLRMSKIPRELRDHAGRLEHRFREIARVAAALRQIADRMEAEGIGQQQLFPVDETAAAG